MATKEQLIALKFLIFKSKDANEFAKKICFCLINQTNFLKRPVRISFRESEEFPADFMMKEVISSTDFLYSSNGQTHINTVLHAMGSNFCFTHKNGYYDDSGNWHGGGKTWTVYLSHKYYEDKAFQVKATKKEIEGIDLIKEGQHYLEDRP